MELHNNTMKRIMYGFEDELGKHGGDETEFICLYGYDRQMPAPEGHEFKPKCFWIQRDVFAKWVNEVLLDSPLLSNDYAKAFKLINKKRVDMKLLHWAYPSVEAYNVKIREESWRRDELTEEEFKFIGKMAGAM